MRNTRHAGLLLLTLTAALSGCNSPTFSGPTPVPPLPADTMPTVTAVYPPLGSTVGATPVLIVGTGFRPGAIVTIGAEATSVILVHSTTITAATAAHPGAIVDVVVTNPGGASGRLDGAFIYAAEPFSVTPSVDTVVAGGEMSVSWTAPLGGREHWIAIFPVGGPYEDDWYGLTRGETSGTLTVTAPDRTGRYEFRYLLNDNGYIELAHSHPITVKAQ
jgi:IPT/TIG domain